MEAEVVTEFALPSVASQVSPPTVGYADAPGPALTFIDEFQRKTSLRLRVQ
jgi:hypothetical protein